MMKEKELIASLKSLENKIEEHKKEERYIDLDQACDLLRCSKSFLYKKTANREIPFYRPGGKKIYFSVKELHDWIKKHPCKSKAEIELETDLYIQNKEKF